MNIPTQIATFIKNSSQHLFILVLFTAGQIYAAEEHKYHQVYNQRNTINFRGRQHHAKPTSLSSDQEDNKLHSKKSYFSLLTSIHQTKKKFRDWLYRPKTQKIPLVVEPAKEVPLVKLFKKYEHTINTYKEWAEFSRSNRIGANLNIKRVRAYIKLLNNTAKQLGIRIEFQNNQVSLVPIALDKQEYEKPSITENIALCLESRKIFLRAETLGYSFIFAYLYLDMLLHIMPSTYTTEKLIRYIPTIYSLLPSYKRFWCCALSTYGTLYDLRKDAPEHYFFLLDIPRITIGLTWLRACICPSLTYVFSYDLEGLVVPCCIIYLIRKLDQGAHPFPYKVCRKYIDEKDNIHKELTASLAVAGRSIKKITAELEEVEKKRIVLEKETYFSPEVVSIILEFSDLYWAHWIQEKEIFNSYIKEEKEIDKLPWESSTTISKPEKLLKIGCRLCFSFLLVLLGICFWQSFLPIKDVVIMGPHLFKG